MAGSPLNLHTMDCRSAYIQGVLKVKVKIKGHVIRALSWILGMSYSVIDGLVIVSGCILRKKTIMVMMTSITTTNSQFYSPRSALTPSVTLVDCVHMVRPTIMISSPSF